MSNRKHIPLKSQLAAALLQLVDAKGERLIPYADSKRMTAAQVVSLFELDHHPIRVADGGTSDPWNLTWRLRAEHRRKTATIDQPELGKQRRIRAREAEHKRLMNSILGDLCSDCPPAAHPDKTRCDSCPLRVIAKQKIPSRPFPAGRKFASRR